jgi:hypothetical protein
LPSASADGFRRSLEFANNSIVIDKK